MPDGGGVPWVALACECGLRLATAFTVPATSSPLGGRSSPAEEPAGATVEVPTRWTLTRAALVDAAAEAALAVTADSASGTAVRMLMAAADTANLLDLVIDLP